MNHTLNLDRRRLLMALDRFRGVLAARCIKPILRCVHLQAGNGELSLAATDGEMFLSARLPVQGDLPACVVSGEQLVARLKGDREAPCRLSIQPRMRRLLIQGGVVEHALPLEGPREFPPVPGLPAGKSFSLPPAVLGRGLAAALPGIAESSSRYAINGLLIESDKAGRRIVATDGRRMVTVELPEAVGRWAGATILPARAAKLLIRLCDTEPGTKGTRTRNAAPPPSEPPKDNLIVVIRKAEKEGVSDDIGVVGPDWLLTCRSAEGSFPHYRDIMPRSASRFIVGRGAFMEVLKAVARAASWEFKGVSVDLTARQVRLTSGSKETGRASGTVRAGFDGGGDAEIHTAFDPAFLLEAFRTIPDQHVVIDVGQNKPPMREGDPVGGVPALFYGRSDDRVRWLIMPIGAGLPPTRENLGSNYREPKEAAASAAGPAKPAAAVA